MILKNIWVHSALLAVAAAFGWQALTRTEATLAEGGVEVWGGKPAELSRIEFENEKRRVVFDFKSDDVGRYAIGDVDRVVSDKTSPPDQAEADDPEAAPKEETPPGAVAQRETVRFIGAKDLAELVEKLVPLRTLRDLGKIEGERLAEYGLADEKLPHVKLQVGGNSYELWFGGATPGGSDVYAFNADRSRAFVIPNSILRHLESAESRLIERSLHSFDDDAATRVRIKAGEASRELVRSTEAANFWTDAANAAGKDETASNWMKNFERLRITDYVENAGDLKPLFRAEYLDKQGKNLGFVEFASRPEPGKDKPQYLVRSELTRWWGVVLASTAESVAQDVPSVVK